MVRIREFENGVGTLFHRNLVRGSTHLYNGQEAVAVGAVAALRPTDPVTCTYRGHGVVLARGSDPVACYAEILGRSGGLCGGKGGSMHLTDVSRAHYGSHAIVGAHLPIAVGLGLGAQYRGTDEVSLTFFGDGTVNIGAFHEALNLAAVWSLPVVFVIENNLYGEYSPVAATTPITRLADRAAGYAMPGVQVDGNDVHAVRDIVATAAERARGGGGPTLIEALTYRQVGHSRSDPATYRPEGELDAWLERDPITLLERFIGDAAATASVRERVAAEITAALDAALALPEPDEAELLTDVIG
ncbi:pyruvate dehydrogenase (acetyl-transferring) E1 component subunit alpha [Jiangella anatolica]|uniref:Pyruvate dehydrogenase (Acetyl-transferring) E1 component subunit alpha n=2 Tax=Jiangella anatolica TaxID=2670374 RepID=A0A2W2AWI0_9ACTN|nr:pyruvate dehydrogenase (acetyl-transferring) E1 component subunit alpha [Jiangella anatolica]